ncbi:thiamine diphosphate-binding protein [Cubamyces sp. BRFM 1775]|nr:thiamine diphosphate-binding protein [Cubamyces sp. BRFM 1775]
MYTTASVFFKTLANAGITHAFVNWGSDHAALLEELQRQRAEDGKTLIDIVTCPSEYVALSAAHGYAQITGKPAVVIIHGDVGTQTMAGAVHNADKGQMPVLIFAGSAPCTANGELRGSKDEYGMWFQDVPDQPAIVRQYMRYVAQIQSGKNASNVIMRALQIATSQPKGPVYLWARREVIEEDVDEATVTAAATLSKWPSVTPGALTSRAVDTITSALVHAEFPLILTANAGRNPSATQLLAELSSALAIGVLACASSSVPIAGDHPYLLGYHFWGKQPHLDKADVVLVLDIDVPWVDADGCEPRAGAKVFVIDNDPLKRTFGWSHVDADLLCTADTETALGQLIEAVRAVDAETYGEKVQARRRSLGAIKATRQAQLSHAENLLAPDGVLPTVPMLLAALRSAVAAQTFSGGQKILYLTEAASVSGLVWNHLAPAPGSMFMSGGTSLGWVLGASIGMSIGAKVAQKGCDLVVSLTGDGNFLFGAPTATFWVAKKYNTPFLMIVVNNHGWFSPKFSMRAVHPTGHGSVASGEKLSVGFGQDGNVDYAGVAAAAGGAWACQVARADQLRDVFEEAVRVVTRDRRCAVVDCLVESI